MTIVASWGSPDANSYVELSEANTFITTNAYDPLGWTSATTIQREAVLLQACRDINSREYLGRPLYPDQALPFPRASEQYAATRMERAVKQAQCLQALFLSRNDGKNEHAERISMGIKQVSERIGPISESYTYAGNKLGVLCADAISALGPWLSSRKAVRG